MIIYLLKAAACAAIFLAIYHSFLEKEKMFRFNRFYLLFSVVFSFLVPLITFEVEDAVGPVAQTEMIFTEGFQKTVSSVLQPVEPQLASTDFLPIILFCCYGLITAFLLFRFIINIAVIFRKIRSSESLPYFGARLVLTDKKHASHSFLKFIFINKEDFRGDTIEQEILSHELAHVKQMHSLDILFIELLCVFVWINPLLFYYKKAIVLNHEFLADDDVLSEYHDKCNYQELLVNTVIKSGSPSLAHKFNYLITKKRLLMMNKEINLQVVLLKKIALIPIIGLAVFTFSARESTAQEVQQKGNQAQINQNINTASDDPVKEYKNIISKYKSKDDKLMLGFRNRISKYDYDRLASLFKKLSKSQRDTQEVVFMGPFPPLPRITPTKQQMHTWRKADVYGVWVDGKRVSNNTLKDYSNTDFEQVFISKISKNSKNYGKHYYQVDLMTKKHYQDYYDETILKNKENKSVMMIQHKVKIKN